MSSSALPSTEIELEEKFALPPDGNWSSVEAKLLELGFVPKKCGGDTTSSNGGGAIKFTDTYYDKAAPNWYLTPRDCWLRFRGQRGTDSSEWRGNWQLKIRRRSAEDGGAAATAYEEIEGEEALERASEMLPAASTGSSENDNEQLIDDAPKAPDGLIPFAQFETSRSSWVLGDATSSTDYVGLTVDIDATEFGYGVGEVEAILGTDDDMADARRRISQLVAEISGGNTSEESNLPPLGKLETYLIERRRKHYEAIKNAGIFKPV